MPNLSDRKTPIDNPYNHLLDQNNTQSPENAEEKVSEKKPRIPTPKEVGEMRRKREAKRKEKELKKKVADDVGGLKFSEFVKNKDVLLAEGMFAV